MALAAFSEQWVNQYHAIAPGWERNWERLTSFYDYSPALPVIGSTPQHRKLATGFGTASRDD